MLVACGGVEPPVSALAGRNFSNYLKLFKFPFACHLFNLNKFGQFLAPMSD